MPNGDVIFGGDFTRCGNVHANRIVRFDGSQFFSVGTGLENGISSSVYAVFVDGAKIYASGLFKRAGQTSANNIAVFESGIWRSVGRGSSNGVNFTVRAIQTFQGKLYVGGFDRLTRGARLREWNGSGWRNVGNFFDVTNVDGAVNALAVSDSKLYLGGTFGLITGGTAHIGTFDGTSVTYESFPTGTSSSRVRDLHFFQGKLCVAGSFRFPASLGGGGGVACRLLSGWQTYDYFGMRGLGDDGSTLYATGFVQASSARLVAVGLGDVPITGLGGSDYLLTVDSQNNSLILGGDLANRNMRAQGLIRVASLGAQPVVQGDTPELNGNWDRLASTNGKIFGHSTSSNAFSQPLETESLAFRENGLWRAIDKPFPDGTSDTIALLALNDELYSSQSRIGELSLHRLENSNWVQVAANVTVNAVYGDSLINIPTYANPITGEHVIERFNGTILEPWLTVPGLKRNGQLIGLSAWGLPLSLVEYKGRPVLAGQFDEMVGVGPVGGVATYFDGGWHALGAPGLLDPKWTDQNESIPIRLQVFNNQLYASNGFTQANGQAVDGISKLEGSAWRALDGGITHSESPAARANVNMIVYNDELYAYGAFDFAGGEPANGAARWNGSQWRALQGPNGQGFGESGFVNKAVVSSGELHFSGNIHEAGGQPIDFFASWKTRDLQFSDGFEAN